MSEPYDVYVALCCKHGSLSQRFNPDRGCKLTRFQVARLHAISCKPEFSHFLLDGNDQIVHPMVEGPITIRWRTIGAALVEERIEESWIAYAHQGPPSCVIPDDAAVYVERCSRDRSAGVFMCSLANQAIKALLDDLAPEVSLENLKNAVRGMLSTARLADGDHNRVLVSHHSLLELHAFVNSK